MTPEHLRSRLHAYLARRSPARSLGPLVALTGGRASSLYTVTLDRAELVLKMYAPNAQGRAHAIREWRALTHLRAMDHFVPRGVLLEPDARHLGHPFVLMDRIPGVSFWHAFEAADPVAQARLTRSYVAQLVALHALDPQLLEPSAVPTQPYASIDHELAQLRRDSAASPHATLPGIVHWLEQRRQAVPCERPAILHRDFHPWNVLVDAAERLWVIDWDWQIGDARFDLAWTCMLMRRSDVHEFSTAVRDEYARQSDRSLDELGYFEVLTTVRWLLNVLPAVGADSPLEPAARADFRAFLVEPVRRAQAHVHDRTGRTVTIRM